MTSEKANRRGQQTKAPWSVVVLYEDADTRDEAVRLCDQLVGELWHEPGVDVSWWSFSCLQEGDSASEATAKAIGADLIVFATRPAGALPSPVRQWVEAWVDQRGEREGALLGLFDTTAVSAGAAADKFAYLRNAAHRAGLDYLTQASESFWHRIPDSIESYSDRADRMTSVLEEILQQRPPPPPRPN